jgi:hypothetical protein
MFYEEGGRVGDAFVRTSGEQLMAQEDELREKTTRHLAATAIAHPKFTDAALLPRATPIPFNNIGHLPFVDALLLRRIIWGLVTELRDEQLRFGSVRKTLRLVLTAIVGAGFFVAANLVASSIPPDTEPFWPGLVVGGILAGVTWELLSGDFKKKAAKKKALAVEQLLTGKAPSCEQYCPVSSSDDDLTFAAGDGMVSEERALVFFMYNASDPFPGLGWHQARELFVCPILDEERASCASSDVLFDIGARVAAATVAHSGVRTASTGLAVLVDAKTIGTASEWLHEGRPLLYIPSPTGSRASIEMRDKKASARAYNAVQLILTEYQTCVTVFLRPFRAGTSGAFEIIVLTLGPPLDGIEELHARLHLHKRRVSGGKDSRPAKRATPTNIASRLRLLREQYEARRDPFEDEAAYSSLKELYLFDKAASAEERAEAVALGKTMNAWPGFYTREPNWRELWSLSLTNDFFGSTECKAATLSFYDHLSRAMLTALEEQGFDISKYRSATGQWTINADSIANMVVGERIVMPGDKDGSETAASSKTKAATKSRDAANESHNKRQGATP